MTSIAQALLVGVTLLILPSMLLSFKKTNVTCFEGQYLCKDDGVTCIYGHEVCDGYKDCVSGDDEANCRVSAADCHNDEYYCVYNSRCISKRWICDGDNDCGDGADENPRNCTPKVKPTVSPREFEDCEEYSCVGLTGECLPWSRVCDGGDDCSNGVDEGGLCSSACQVDNGGCSQMCRRTPDGSKCTCYNGYSLFIDGKTCEDINECENPGICTQFCNNTKGGFKCSCADGYFLEHNNRKCKAVDGTATFVYLLPDKVKGIDLSTRVQRVPMKGQGEDMRGMDYDASEGIFFWSEWKEGTINSYIQSTNRQEVLLTTPVRPHYLRWDWIVKNIYYTDDEGSIVCCSKNGKYCFTVIHNVAPHVNSFDISPTTGLMFWTVWEVVRRQESGVLERAELDGSHSIVIVSDRIVWPSAVTVDHLLKMVYWTDAKLNLMECTDFHGLNRRTVVSQGMYFPFAMTMFEDYVYWADWGTNEFIRCDKFGGRNCSPLRIGEAKTEIVMVIHKAMQPKGLNRCGADRCSQLCIQTRTSYVCKCGSGYLEKNSTCVLKSTAGPVVATTPSCPTDYCFSNAPCRVIEGNFLCMCPPPFKGVRCEITVVERRDFSFIVGWFIVGLSMAVLFIYFVFF